MRRDGPLGAMRAPSSTLMGHTPHTARRHAETPRRRAAGTFAAKLRKGYPESGLISEPGTAGAHREAQPRGLQGRP
eukprot:7073032-Prymnesium_polylepis.1